MPDVVLIPVEEDRRVIGYDTIFTPTSAGDNAVPYKDKQIIYWHNEAQQLREVLRIFYDKVRTISDDPEFYFTVEDLDRAKELLTRKATNYRPSSCSWARSSFSARRSGSRVRRIGA